MCADVPKQFLPLGGEGKPVLVHTLERFLGALPAATIVVALPQEQIPRWEQIASKWGLAGTHAVCAGGDTRFGSVKSALEHVGGCDCVAVHDGVRPLVGADLIRRAFATAYRCGSAVPVVQPADSFRSVADDLSSLPLDRTHLRAVQTPQAFDHTLLAAAYQSPYQPRFTDDASVVENTGCAITLIEGERANIKITTPEDMAIATALLSEGY